MKEDDLFESISNVINEFNKNLEKQILLIEREVSDIIQYRITDTQSIEGMLDLLLGFVPWDFGKKEFKALNSYYSTINPGNAISYWTYYQESIAEEE